jgi:superfamily II DNA or RNA helicase
MSDSPSGKELFIVDNSISGWTGLEYLKQWTEVAKSMDIATGYFEIGALSELHGQWQKLEKIRILMGDEMTFRTNKAIRKAEVLKKNDDALDASLEAAKDKNPFLKHVPEIIEGMRSGKIECRVYDKTKFHAKAYITHGKLAVVGSQALVGSSNFTGPGLTSNVELNVQVQSSREVAQLQEWFEHHWNEGVEVTEQVAKVIERHTRDFTPFEVYAKALQEYFKGHELTEAEWDQTKSQMFGKLDRYQKEAYWSLLKIAKQHGGAFLCDGVGLGKTFVGLMLIEKLVMHEGKRVVLLAPKSAKEGVWETHLKKYLSHISGQGNDFSNLVVVSHTDLGREGEWPERFKRMAELADAVIIDEAHHFRNPGSRANPEKGTRDSRYYELYKLLDDAKRKKTLFLLTATPINNRLSDFRHMVELFSRQKDDYFARTLGVNNLTAHFNKMEKDLRKKLGGDDSTPIEGTKEAGEMLSADQIFHNLVVQRSRAYARQSQLAESGKAAVFPKRKDPQVAAYSIRKTYGKLLTMFQEAFDPEEGKPPLFTLTMYYPLAWYKGPDKSIDPMEEGRQQQVVGLIRTNFLKRFESSVTAFEMSSERLMGKLLAFVEKNSTSPSEKKRLERWKSQNASILDYAKERQLELWGKAGEEDEDDEDVVTPEMLEAAEQLDPDLYDVDEMLSETYLDLDQIIRFITECRKFSPESDDKLQKLIALLKSPELKGQKVLIFSEFADTARYLKEQLAKYGIDGLDEVDSGDKRSRSEILKRFAPYYNGETSASLKEKKLPEIRVLICTDVLSEGLNLQDATKMINYDIHWNPVRLMQRIGRVDRRMNPETEANLKEDHPDQAKYRGEVAYWNFLPPEDLNVILTLYRKVTQKTLLISETLGIEGKKLLTPEDNYKAIKEFNEAYEGTTSVIEQIHLEYQALIKANPELEKELAGLPRSVFSGKKSGAATTGVFFCYALPAMDNETKSFTEAAGITRWYLYNPSTNKLDQEPADIVPGIRCEPKTHRKCVMSEKDLKDARVNVEKHITNTYLKQIQAPMGVKPTLKCWMEIN